MNSNKYLDDTVYSKRFYLNMLFSAFASIAPLCGIDQATYAQWEVAILAILNVVLTVISGTPLDFKLGPKGTVKGGEKK